MGKRFGRHRVLHGVTVEPRVESEARRAVLAAAGCAVFVFAAVAVEVLAGTAANSPAPRWADGLVPLAWPPVARVVWWLVVAAAALAYRLALARIGLRPNSVVTGLLVAPFVAFALGIAVGAEWATWH